MKILIVSDTHKKHDNLVRILEQEENIDLMVHLGDSEGYEDYIAELAGCPLEIVSGNNDFFTDLDREKVLEVGKYQVLITHGHYYYVAMGVEDLKKEALGRGMDIVMFGHTHRPLLDYSKGIVTLNPSSVSFPKQEGRRPSYALMELDQEGEAHFKIKYL